MYIAIAGNIGAGKSTLTQILSERYLLTPVYEAVDENPYLEDFYQEFLVLLKYAPSSMNQQAKVARFVSRLTSPLRERLQDYRLTTFADILDIGKPIEQELINAKKKNLANNPTNV